MIGRSWSWVVGPLVCASLCGQGIVVPTQSPDQDAASLGPIAGFCAGHRQQILIDKERILELRGKTIRSLWVRRDGFFQGALNAASADLTITLSETDARSASASSVFAANRGATTVVAFQGRVVLPASPRLDERFVPWSSPHALQIQFSTPFAYVGNNLCVEIDGRPVGSGNCFRPFDFDYEGAPGQVTKYGVGCGRFATGNGLTASASASGMRLGSTAVFYSWGQPNTAGFLLIGDAKHWPGLDLSPIGATGCSLYVTPVSTMGAVFDSPLAPGEPGTAILTFRMPNNRSLAGAQFWAQWVNLETNLPRNDWSNPLGATTTNGLEVTLSSFPPALGMATVLSHIVQTGQAFPATGRINVTRAPVFKFDF